MKRIDSCMAGQQLLHVDLQSMKSSRSAQTRFFYFEQSSWVGKILDADDQTRRACPMGSSHHFWLVDATAEAMRKNCGRGRALEASSACKVAFFTYGSECDGGIASRGWSG